MDGIGPEGHDHAGRGPSEGHDHAGRGPSEAVVVDIGGTVGALVVTTTAAVDGAQIEICSRTGDPQARTHTIVRAREVPGHGIVYAGVFPALVAGQYHLLAWGDRPAADLSVTGGAVTEVDWSAG